MAHTKFRKVGGRFYYKIELNVTHRNVLRISNDTVTKHVERGNGREEVVGSIPVGPPRVGSISIIAHRSLTAYFLKLFGADTLDKNL